MSDQDQTNALKSLDVDWLRKQISVSERPGDECLLLSLHKARYERPDMPKELRHESGKWLRDRGYHRLFNADVLDEGELPE